MNWRSILLYFVILCIVGTMCTESMVEESPIPLLPPVPEEEYEGKRSLNLGDTMSLDYLGPIIINLDGTTRRIANWNTLTKQEQESSWRRIRERNKIRLEQLRKSQDSSDDSSVSGSVTEADVVQDSSD